MLRRLDHVLREVPDIEAAFGRLRASGFPEAWPVGPFWPGALTAGVALGGLNLELIQPLDRPPLDHARRLVFEPVSVDDAFARLTEEGLSPTVFEKIEPDPALLRLRGFPEPLTGEPQRICTNVHPSGEVDSEFFVCDYAPFLRTWLSPSHPRLAPPFGPAQAVVVAASEDRRARYARLRPPAMLETVPGEGHEALHVRFADRRLDLRTLELTV